MAKNKATEASAETPRPLFFHTPQVINLDRHEHAKLRPGLNMEYARNTNSIPLSMSDIQEAAKFYPIVFTQTDPVIPIAIVGLERENYYIDESGNWLPGYYVPAYVRKYPFVFVDMPDEQKLTLCIDESVLSFDPSADGTSLYEDGQPSTFTNAALEFCTAYQEQHVEATLFCKGLSEQDGLLPQRSDIKLANGRQTQLGGFQIINTDMLATLSENTIIQWYQRGFLAQVYYVLQSQSNWKGLLEMGNRYEESRD
jgi:hypothetical protein